MNYFIESNSNDKMKEAIFDKYVHDINHWLIDN